jgi:hypothetical protein
MEELAKFLASCEFATPLYFWIGGALVLLLIFFPWARKRRGLAIDLQYWRPRVVFKSKRVWVLSIPVVIISILMAGAFYGPHIITRTSTLIYGKPVMLVVDVSGSMITGTELEPQLTNREVALEAYNDFIARRTDINFGLIIYSTENYVARYFTYKNELFKDTLENEEEIYRIAKGTRTAEALAKARLFFADNIEDKGKAIVLISDLNYDCGAFSDMIEEIGRDLLAGINVYVIYTLGEIEAVATIPQMSGLKIIAINDKYGIDQIYKEMSAMQRSPIKEEGGLLKESLIPFLILPALGMIILCLILSETRFRKIP